METIALAGGHQSTHLRNVIGVLSALGAWRGCYCCQLRPTAPPAPAAAAMAGSWLAGGCCRCWSAASCPLPAAALPRAGWEACPLLAGSACSAPAAGRCPDRCPENFSIDAGSGGTADALFACEPSSLASLLGVAPLSTLRVNVLFAQDCTDIRL